jgi:hypothetical protein
MTNHEGMTKPENSGELEESFWLANEASHVREVPDAKPAYDLEERTARFGEAIIDFAKRMPAGPLTERIISQLVGAGTSVGANYDEADDAVSKKGVSKVHWHVQKRSTREQALSTHGRLRRSRIEARSARPVARSESIALILCENLEERKREMTKRETRIIRHPSFVLPSSFVIRPSSF